MKDIQMLRKALWVFIRLLTQLIQNLLSPEKGEEWLTELKKFLRKEPCWVSRAKSFLTTTLYQFVDYDRSVADSVKAGRYKRSNDSIADENFPSDEFGKQEVKFGLFHFNKTTSTDEAIALMRAEGFRPATLKELLAFGEKNPEEQRNYPVGALGSVTRLDDFRLVGCLFGYGSERFARLRCYDVDWGPVCRFLAVRN